MLVARFLKVAFIPIILTAFFLTYYANDHITLHSKNPIFLTIGTFLFSIFAGFFIAQQRRRHANIRSNIAHFDGVLSFIYRSLGHFNNGSIKRKCGVIVIEHYKHILESKSWDYHIIHPSNTLKNIHNVIDSLNNQSFQTLRTNMLNRISAGLLQAQIAREDLLILHQERISTIQWIIIYFLFGTLLVSLHTILSEKLFVESFLKASFATTLLYIILLMHQLNDLSLFEHTIGESSAQEIIAIIKKDQGE